ncbi:hypothetical protein BD289DRAFT_441911 [Coniella lustricola]|uniref:Spc7 kinetochore protein domain-containing protein n=1 Tax=Coniella lustricola TaxID=2025994 RepID=A0A2T2ZYT4_9PEZI|nr:hypothetical protein BD289DRAFT_441911 [Coniella lustricola]
MAGGNPTSTTRRMRKSLSVVDREHAPAALGAGLTLAENRKKAKSRSKSMGPGGLDALKAGSGNRRVSLANPTQPPPRSILKPTIPLPEIPSFKSRIPQPVSSHPSTETTTNENHSESSGTKVAVRSEEEQQATARDREEQERAAAAEKEAKDRRDARRKSLANRRVSFAAEATLHTFHEIEYMQDSTTSTDSRRASSLAAQSPAAQQSGNAVESASGPPSTPPEHNEETVAKSPEDQRRLHQKNRRRSSGGAPSRAFDNQQDNTVASTVYDSDVDDDGDDVAEVQSEASDSNDDSDSDGTMVTVEAEEMTSMSLASSRYRDEGEESATSSLDGALKEAAQRAVDQTREPDEDEEVIPGFIGWGKHARQRQQQASLAQPAQPRNNLPSSSPYKSSPLKSDADGTEMGMDMDMTNAIGGIIDPDEPESPSDDVSMDVTHVLGGILPQLPNEPDEQQAGDGESIQGDQTMDLTTAIGSIQQGPISEGDSDHQSDEEMSMELTTVMGRVLAAKNKQVQASFPPSSSPIKEKMGNEADTEQVVDGDDEMGMDITAAFGGIFESHPTPDDRTAAKQLMEQEADEQPLTTGIITSTSQQSSTRTRLSTAAGPSKGSPSFSAFRGTSIRRSSGILFPAAPKSPSIRNSSRTPSPERHAATARTSSPRTKAISKSPKSATKQSTGLFQQDSTLPIVVLTPQRPKLSGVGIDRSGVGSPRVTEILSRRSSIGDSAAVFSPVLVPGQRKAVAFEDPKILEEEIDQDKRDDEERENFRRGVSDDRDATLNLKEMILGLSPKKNPMKGRKSLHVGSAKGLLGKRPSELDNDSDTEEQDGVKRLKGLQGSPVKNIRLQQPPSKAETTGSRATVARDENVDNESTPTTGAESHDNTTATTPVGQKRFYDAEDQPTRTINFNASPSINLPELQPNEGGDKLHLQDFLNMTSIRFMELTTTKRRHTIMPSARKGSLSAEDKDGISLEKCVVAGACTVPMLELYQHSCRELKKYIAEGRRIVREIETETFEENPPLFKEYISASPEFRSLMDNQFKNVKTHARLLSKAMWYEWRMKLQEGLREGLVKTAEGMTADQELLDKQQKLLSSALPAMLKQSETLGRECDNLEALASELQDCDPQELESARADLLAVDSDVQAKKREIALLQAQLQEAEGSVEQLTERKRGCHSDIAEAEKIRQEYRGWTGDEIKTLKARVDAIEAQHGWAIKGAKGTVLSMTYLREIELVFDVAALKAAQADSRVEVRYVAVNRDQSGRQATPEVEFCVQSIRSHVTQWAQTRRGVSRMLQVVSAGWDRARVLSNQVRQLNLMFPTLVKYTSASSLVVKSALLLAPLKTKIEVVLQIQSTESASGVEFIVSPQAGVVYGEQFNAAKLVGFLTSRLGDRVYSRKEKATESWCGVVSDLHGKLASRSRK